MIHSRRILRSAAFALAWGGLLAFTLGLPAQAAQPTKVAAIGDSITFGFGIPAASNTYPEHLQDLLGPAFEVENFGRSGARATDASSNPYSASPQHAAAQAFNPHIVVSNLGINDFGLIASAGGQNTFVADYTDILDDYQAGTNNNPDYLTWTKLGPVIAPHQFVAAVAALEPTYDSILGQVSTNIGSVGLNMQLPFTNEPGFTSPSPNAFMSGDGIHPTSAGALLIATETRNQLLAQQGVAITSFTDAQGVIENVLSEGQSFTVSVGSHLDDADLPQTVALSTFAMRNAPVSPIPPPRIVAAIGAILDADIKLRIYVGYDQTVAGDGGAIPGTLVGESTDAVNPMAEGAGGELVWSFDNLLLDKDTLYSAVFVDGTGEVVALTTELEPLNNYAGGRTLGSTNISNSQWDSEFTAVYSVVPEPASFALLALGGFSLSFSRRSFRKPGAVQTGAMHAAPNVRTCFTRISICIAVLLVAVSRTDADTYDLYIVTGQSNTLGSGGNLGQLTAAEQLQPDVGFRYWNHNGIDLTTGALRVQGSSYGPEMTLGRQLADAEINAASGRKVFVVKVAFGGTAIHEFAERRPAWDVDLVGQTFDLPAGVSPDHSLGPGVTVGGIHHYERSINTIDDTITDLQADGHTVNVAGAFWMQGESDSLPDALDGFNGADLDDQPATQYESNLNQMVGDLRTRYNANLPFVFGRIRNRTDSSFYVSEVKQSMNDSAAADQRIELVTTDDFFVNDGVHFRNHYDDLGDRFFNAFQRIKNGDTAQLIIEDSAFAVGTWSTSVLDVDGVPGGEAAAVSQTILNDSNGPLDRRGSVLFATQTVPANSDTRVALIKEDASYDPSISGPILNLNMGANQSETPTALDNTSAYRYLLLQDGMYYAVESSIHQTFTGYGQRENNGLGDAELAASDFRLWDPVTHDFALGAENVIRPDFVTGGEIKFGLLLDATSPSGETFENYFDDFAVDISYDPNALLLGDLTGDGLVNEADVTKFVANWRSDTSGQSVVLQAGVGDLNFNGRVDLADAGILHQALETAGSSVSVFDALFGVPEPSSLTLLGLGGLTWTLFRRQNGHPHKKRGNS